MATVAAIALPTSPPPADGCLVFDTQNKSGYTLPVTPFKFKPKSKQEQAKRKNEVIEYIISPTEWQKVGPTSN